MTRVALLACVVSATAFAAAAPANKFVTESQCPSDLGRGVKSRRVFCDIAAATDPAKGDVVRIPPHTGASTLRFDLHNRFAVAGKTLPFARATALVAVLNANSGAVIERAAVMGELRAELDLFDRIVGTGPGGTKTIAPGRAEPVTLKIPAAVTAISIVGVRVEVTTKAGTEVFSSPGRPVAIVSNLRLEYTPSAVGK
ncbi:MAG: hypothetical protein EPO35_12815 [Acidobacteria bacterium]|nr:MAG: hypothetical protein EPO35_12815 [Acidobacteriota bacterium]